MGGGGLAAEFGTTARPASLKTPDGLTDGKKYPLIMVLHGFGVTGLTQSAYLGASALPGRDEAFVIAPDGTVNNNGMQFWNADPACCDLNGQNPDDVGYLGGMLDDILATDWPIDPGRVFVIGHSNGGFMAYRMACERADIVAAVMSLAGLAASTPTSCMPDQPVNVLQAHGTADGTVPYAYMGFGAEPTVAQWAGYNGCSGTTRTPGTTADFDGSIAGSETTQSSTQGCPDGGAADLWKLTGSGHIPNLTADFTSAMLAWLVDHSRS